MNPYDIVNEMENVTGENPESIISNGKFSFTVEVKNKYQADKVTSLWNIKNLPCKIYVHPTLNSSKGLIFLTEFDINDIDLFKANLKVKYNVN